MIAVGWTGQWLASFARFAEGVHVRAGMERTHLRLLPGESIRMPRIALLFWNGSDHLRGYNLFRSFVLAYHTPRPGGRLPSLPVAAMPWFLFDNGNGATEENQTEFASLYFNQKIPVDAFWLDAGWFEGGWPNGVGTWFVRKDAFPRGLRPLSNAVHRMGMRFIVWFEPETVAPGTWLDIHHPEWLLPARQQKQKLLNLGNKQARLWLTDHISRLIEQEGIDIYRNDFSLNPLEYWRSADAPDRQGITEIRYVEGLYAYWDELLRRHPNLLIDNGASGGRRIDLETMSRSVPLWRFDYFGGKLSAYQTSGAGLGLYVPLSGAGVPPTPRSSVEMADRYAARSSMGAGEAFTWDVRRPNFDDALARQVAKEQKIVRKFFYGDLYPLTGITPDEGSWLAYQCDRPDMGAGLVVAFRRELSNRRSLSVKLRGLRAEAVYVVEDVDRGARKSLKGKDLAEGLELDISTTPGSALMVYTLKR
jgi:alpha-galactosidase